MSLTLVQCVFSNNNKPDYQNKHLVAIKRMKKSFKDWRECEKLKELKVCRRFVFVCRLVYFPRFYRHS